MKIKERAQRIWANHKFVIGMIAGAVISQVVGEIVGGAFCKPSDGPLSGFRLLPKGMEIYPNEASVADIKADLLQDAGNQVFDAVAVNYSQESMEKLGIQRAFYIRDIVSAE